MLRFIQSGVVNPILRAELATVAQAQLALMEDTTARPGRDYEGNTSQHGVWDSLWRMSGGPYTSPLPGNGLDAASQEFFESYLDRASMPVFLIGTRGDWRSLRRQVIPAMEQFMESLGHEDPDLLTRAQDVGCWVRAQGYHSPRASATRMVNMHSENERYPLPGILARTYATYGTSRIVHVRGIMTKEVHT